MLHRSCANKSSFISMIFLSVVFLTSGTGFVDGAVQGWLIRCPPVTRFSAVSAFVILFAVSVTRNLGVDGQQSSDDRCHLPARHLDIPAAAAAVLH